MAEAPLSLSVLSSAFLSTLRRVHISSVTLEHLKGSYKVEPGDGPSRDSYLKDNGVVTYLVINPKVRSHQPSQKPSVKNVNINKYRYLLLIVCMF